MFPAGDPCLRCQAWASGFMAGGSFGKRAARWNLEPIALAGSNSGDEWSVSSATATYAEMWRSFAIREMESLFRCLPSFPRFRRRFKEVLKREEYLDPAFWLAKQNRLNSEAYWLMWDALAMDKRCFMIYILTPTLHEDWVSAGPVGYATRQHSFTRKELLALIASPTSAVRELGLKLMTAARPVSNRRSR